MLNRSSTRPRLVPTLLLIALAITVGACGNGAAAPDLAYTGGPIDLPTPTGEIVLTLTGDVAANVDDRVELDVAAIESLGTVTVDLNEPFLNQTMTVTGVSLDHLLGAAGVDPHTPLLWTALDEYAVSFTRAEVAAEDGLLAIRVDGQPIPVEEGGPVRVVFPSEDGPLGRDTNQWIWSLRTLRVG